MIIIDSFCVKQYSKSDCCYRSNCKTNNSAVKVEGGTKGHLIRTSKHCWCDKLALEQLHAEVKYTIGWVLIMSYSYICCIRCASKGCVHYKWVTVAILDLQLY